MKNFKPFSRITLLMFLVAGSQAIAGTPCEQSPKSDACKIYQNNTPVIQTPIEKNCGVLAQRAALKLVRQIPQIKNAQLEPTVKLLSAHEGDGAAISLLYSVEFNVKDDDWYDEYHVLVSKDQTGCHEAAALLVNEGS